MIHFLFYFLNLQGDPGDGGINSVGIKGEVGTRGKPPVGGAPGRDGQRGGQGPDGSPGEKVKFTVIILFVF